MSHVILKRTGLGLLSIPLGLLLLFTFGEIFSGDISGLSHLIQAAPLLILIYLAFKKPFLAGLILSILGLALGLWYAKSAHFGFQTILLVEIFLFIPPLISGLLLIWSAKNKSQKKPHKKM